MSLHPEEWEKPEPDPFEYIEQHKVEIIEDWLRALRGGEYPQGKGCLMGDGKFCCLGVLCAVLSDGWDMGKWDAGEYQLAGDSGRAQLPACLPDLLVPRHVETMLVFLNDDQAGKDFNEIADYIEEQLCT